MKGVGARTQSANRPLATRASSLLMTICANCTPVTQLITLLVHPAAVFFHWVPCYCGDLTLRILRKGLLFLRIKFGAELQNY